MVGAASPKGLGLGARSWLLAIWLLAPVPFQIRCCSDLLPYSLSEDLLTSISAMWGSSTHSQSRAPAGWQALGSVGPHDLAIPPGAFPELLKTQPSSDTTAWPSPSFLFLLCTTGMPGPASQQDCKVSHAEYPQTWHARPPNLVSGLIQGVFEMEGKIMGGSTSSSK